ncbi:hypothetical protein Tsp_05102 [Trichinella spiralis]|uniref:hypothetical protein n=1 Tax=Trichinella spiralis TaxID=6334 RepID=UPI0001EFEEF5|nr:hypothetical protein Tsp_05102 [Trichinella spiralis]
MTPKSNYTQYVTNFKQLIGLTKFTSTQADEFLYMRCFNQQLFSYASDLCKTECMTSSKIQHGKYESCQELHFKLHCHLFTLTKNKQHDYILTSTCLPSKNSQEQLPIINKRECEIISGKQHSNTFLIHTLYRSCRKFSNFKCTLLKQPKLSCILIAKGAHNKDAKILGAKFRLIISKQFRPWSEDVFLYAPVTYDPIPESETVNPRGRTGIKGLGSLLHHGQNIIVLYIIARKFGEDIELLSVLDQTNNLKFPKPFIVSDIAYLSGQMKKLFDDKIETAINTIFQKAGYSEERIHVEQKHNPMNTDTSWIETTVFSVWDKEQTHIGSMERFVPVDGLSLGERLKKMLWNH